MCGEALPSDTNLINSHIDACLIKQTSQIEMPSSELASSRTQYEMLDEYTWAGQTRVRATALFEGSYSGFNYLPQL
ncbi:hypothetical protein HK096_004118, partial [Nowakowskiella sp. JEL0078]